MVIMGTGVEIHGRLHRRSKIATKTPISTLEAATILMAMAHSVSNVEEFCNQQLQNIINTKKRNRAAPKQPATRRTKKKKRMEFTSTPEMPAATRDRITETGGYGIQLVIQKQLEDTDVNRNLGRLSLPAKKLKVDFATAEERTVLSQKENKNKKGMSVAIVDPVLRESGICLKKWRIGSDDVYILTTQWNSFVEENGLRSGDGIQLWCFRRDEFEAETRTVVSRLCFAMVKLQDSAN